MKKNRERNRETRSKETPSQKRKRLNGNSARNRKNKIGDKIIYKKICTFCIKRKIDTYFSCGHKVCWRCGTQWLHALCPFCKERITEIIKPTNTGKQTLQTSRSILFSKFFFDESNIPNKKRKYS